METSPLPIRTAKFRLCLLQWLKLNTKRDLYCASIAVTTSLGFFLSCHSMDPPPPISSPCKKKLILMTYYDPDPHEMCFSSLYRMNYLISLKEDIEKKT